MISINAIVNVKDVPTEGLREEVGYRDALHSKMGQPMYLWAYVCLFSIIDR